MEVGWGVWAASDLCVWPMALLWRCVATHEGLRVQGEARQGSGSSVPECGWLVDSSRCCHDAQPTAPCLVSVGSGKAS